MELMLLLLLVGHAVRVAVVARLLVVIIGVTIHTSKTIARLAPDHGAARRFRLIIERIGAIVRTTHGR